MLFRTAMHSNAAGSSSTTTPQARPECLVELGDDVTVIGEWRRADDAIHLSIPTYCTARKTQVTRRTWRLVQGNHGVWRSERMS